MQGLPRLCNIIMREPAYNGKWGNMDKYGLPTAHFWQAYTTILLVRDPFERFLSDMA